MRLYTWWNVKRFILAAFLCIGSGIIWILCISNNALALPIDISINPRATYLHTNGDTPQLPVAIDLGFLEISPNDYIRLEQLGDWDNGPGSDVITSMVGVFSSSTALGSIADLNRVVGAIDAGIDVTTGNTWFGNQPTDIVEDFWIDDIIIQVPTGAAYLFVASHDSLYYDNSDPDSDFGIRISRAVPEPGTILLLGISLVGLVGVGAVRKIKQKTVVNG